MGLFLDPVLSPCSVSLPRHAAPGGWPQLPDEPGRQVCARSDPASSQTVRTLPDSLPVCVSVRPGVSAPRSSGLRRRRGSTGGFGEKGPRSPVRAPRVSPAFSPVPAASCQRCELTPACLTLAKVQAATCSLRPQPCWAHPRRGPTCGFPGVLPAAAVPLLRRGICVSGLRTSPAPSSVPGAEPRRRRACPWSRRGVQCPGRRLGVPEGSGPDRGVFPSRCARSWWCCCFKVTGGRGTVSRAASVSVEVTRWPSSVVRPGRPMAPTDLAASTGLASPNWTAYPFTGGLTPTGPGGGRGGALLWVSCWFGARAPFPEHLCEAGAISTRRVGGNPRGKPSQPGVSGDGFNAHPVSRVATWSPGLRRSP